MPAKQTVQNDETALQLIELCLECEKHSPRSLSTISRLATGSGDTIQRLRRGHGITTVRAAAAFKWLAANWPDNASWPAEIRRPVEAEKAA